MQLPKTTNSIMAKSCLKQGNEIVNKNIKVRKCTVANSPDISGFNKSKTYYVTWDLTSSPYEINESTLISQTAPNNWHDYSEGVNKWANVKTTGGENECYWVWIPRYAYKVPNRNTPSSIEVKFLDGTTNNPIDGSSITISNNTTQGSWNVHPAFWWDKDNDGIEDEGEQLTGIWVAKYEASSSSVSEDTVTQNLTTTGGGDTDTLQVRVIPNVTSWRGITVNNIFKVCRNLTTSGNSVEGATNIDSHMMKNTEWGAVVYLSRSIYGKNGQVYNNPYYNNSTNFSTITGLCGTSQNASQTYLTNTYKYNENNGENQAGINASTTGNVYGVYDMAGGAWEYVAGYLNEETISESSTYSVLASADNKHKDTYAGNSSTDTTNYNANTDKYGDAMYETSTEGTGTASWDTDYSHFVNSSSKVFIRGGHAFNGNNAGVFAFKYHPSSSAYTSISFRPCLVSQQ